MSKPEAKGKGHHEETVVKRVSGKGHHDDHGGAWKVAFADFCLALLCLFLVLWLMASREQQETAEQLRMAQGGSPMDGGGGGRIPGEPGSALGSLISREPVPSRGDDPTNKEGNPGARSSGEGAGPTPKLSKSRYESESDMNELARVLADVSRRAGLEDNLQSVITPYGLRVMLHDTEREGMFKRGSAIPTERFRGLMQALGPLFAQIENQLMIVGHTDSLPYVEKSPTAFSNWALSNSRASAARSHLLMGGMPESSVLQVVGMADRAPMTPDNPRADVNRRIELMVLTPDQARNVSAMYGMPTRSQALVPGSLSVVPAKADQGVAALRTQLLAGRDTAAPLQAADTRKNTP
ncbi:MAG: flagellar motor protein MotB [Aquincola tertiaricarbonis]|uniref:flagellar motor protein MotB n=1 Tax=Aquincola TaxID=391952 RepID=UPI000614F113|nr:MULTISPECIES: flagellar motor protein MotB [Aquincola]MCR5869202.1 OmpA family protein [Aquincola sp. J276]